MTAAGHRIGNGYREGNVQQAATTAADKGNGDGTGRPLKGYSQPTYGLRLLERIRMAEGH